MPEPVPLAPLTSDAIWAGWLPAELATNEIINHRVARMCAIQTLARLGLHAAGQGLAPQSAFDLTV
ncbi:hypothetical protein JNM87_01385 [Candidatus Saccharibacteria bacterium]|nr:hypothetical protein [Candidatus Saccharibacteria bacterium]